MVVSGRLPPICGGPGNRVFGVQGVCALAFMSDAFILSSDNHGL